MRGTILIFASLISATIIFPAHAKIDPASIIGVWLFDEGRGDTARDSSQNNNDGTIEKGCKWVQGKFGQALEFDAKDEYVKIPPSPLFNPQTFTFTFWMFPYTIGGNNPPGKGTSTLIVVNGNPGDGGGGNWWFELWNGGNFEFKSCQVGCSAAVTPITTINRWYFVAGIYNGTEYELYIDGEFKSKGPNRVGAPEKGLLIGDGLCPAGHGCDSGYFNGIVDDVAMFSGILTKDDIMELMDKGVGRVLGISLSVSQVGALPTTWAQLKK